MKENGVNGHFLTVNGHFLTSILLFFKEFGAKLPKYLFRKLEICCV